MEMQRIIITGVSRGLGKDLLHILLTNNKDYEIIGTARTGIESIEEKLRKEFPQGRVHIMELDLF